MSRALFARSGDPHRQSTAMTIPHDHSLGNTFRLLNSEGYEFISNRCRRFGTDIFSTRLLLKKAVCMQGAEAAEQFYFPGRFTRRGAMPRFALKLLQDYGSVQMLDREDHHLRKRMFLSMMTPEKLSYLAELTAFHWWAQARRWQEMESVVLLHEAYVPLCAAVCEWAGLQLREGTVRRRAEEFEAMIEGAGTFGPRNWQGRRMRAHTEKWARKIIRRIRSGRMRVPAGSPAATICGFRDGEGRLLDTRTAAVELLNVLRPTVANARYIVFAALALHEYPEWREKMVRSEEHLGAFVDEVRRFYPFFPFVGGRVLEPFQWRNHRFKKRDWVLFDLYGTNHDPRIWGDPDTFRPERFLERKFGPYELVSHGAGDARVTHRCPGEWITVEQLKAILHVVAYEITYDVPRQDLRIDLTRIPASPGSGLILTNLRVGSSIFRKVA
jgi:fatty-acid peroxygenase